MEINEIKDSLAEEGYCIFEGLLDSQEAERLDGIARSIMESMGSAYISLEGSLNEIPDLAPLCTHPLILEIAEASARRRLFLGEQCGAESGASPELPPEACTPIGPRAAPWRPIQARYSRLGTGYRSSGCSPTAHRRMAPRESCLSATSHNAGRAETAIRRRCRLSERKVRCSSTTTDCGTDPARTRQPTNIACLRMYTICRRCCIEAPRLGP